MKIGKPGLESRTDVGRTARMRICVELKGYKQRGEDRTF